MGEYKTLISIGEYMLVILLWDYPIANKREIGLGTPFTAMDWEKKKNIHR